ncbi:MAG: hypothetical protein M1831_003431 [Alyxoria varia]|nr:MAG: hypothetical protein M1831_003431 [Alyxoria varia]
MTNIDELFKKPRVPGNKRKQPPTQNPEEIYKVAKHAANGDAKGGEHLNGDAQDEEDGSAGPQLPPEDDEIDDEEGRFFSSGITQDTKNALDYMDGEDDEDLSPEKYDVAWLRKTSQKFKKTIAVNAELRAKHEEDPQQFMASEGDLDAEIKALSILTDHTDLYIEFAKMGCVKSLVSLLSHDNTDISIQSVQVLSELTDEDVQAGEDDWNAIVDSMLDADLPDLIAQNFERLDESNEADRNGVYHLLSLVENLSSKSSVLETLLEESSLLKWLLGRIQTKETSVSQNKQYSAEVLSIILQSAEKCKTLALDLDFVEVALQLLSRYRKHDPHKDTEEEEYAENLFDGLSCLVETSSGKHKLLEAEGVELCLIMIREGKFSKPRALRLLDHATSDRGGAEVCEKVVEVGGLSTLFGLFMKQKDQTTTEHVLGILASMFRSLSGNSASRIRVLAKFMEKDYQKLRKLISHRREYTTKLDRVEAQMQEVRQQAKDVSQEDLDSERLFRRLDAGLFSYQTIDVILAWLIAEDGGARAKVTELLRDRDENVADIQSTLREQLKGLANDRGEREADDIDMLQTLIDLV